MFMFVDVCLHETYLLSWHLPAAHDPGRQFFVFFLVEATVQICGFSFFHLNGHGFCNADVRW